MADPVPGPVVSVVVTARDAAGTLGTLLDALAAQDVDPRPEVVVVDDGSSDGTGALAERHPLGPRVLRMEGGAGAGAGRNHGARAARGAVLAFTDADCAPTPGWLRAALGALEHADVAQGRVLPDPAAEPGPWDRSLVVLREHGLYETANLLVRREWFERVGGFDEWLRVGGRPFAEDVWLGWRLRRAGARTAFAPDALVHHAVFAESARDRVRERRRDGLFADLARRVPELRPIFFHRRFFLSPVSLRFDVAVAAVVVAGATRSPLPLAGLAPYAGRVAAEVRRWPVRLAPRVAAATVAGDAVGFASLVRGSLRARTLLL